MLPALLLAALYFPYPSPAKAGVQLQTARYWAPAFAGEAEKGEPNERAVRARAGGTTPIDAERAFAADAKTIGQWTAFRKWSTEDAVMFAPQPVNAHEFLKDRKDPAQAIDWWPTASFMSCDGSLAVNTGGWKRPDGSVGYFSTVWQRQRDGRWKWVLDSGDTLKRARSRPPIPRVRSASCVKGARYEGLYIGNMGGGASSDRTLNWYWTVKDDGSRTLRVGLWNGRRFDAVIDDRVAGSPPNK